MKCVGCDFVIQEDFAFCPKCGARQAVHCASCGYVCPPNFAYCPKCGQKQGEMPQPSRPVPVAPLPTIPAPAGEADRRTITVLFADLSGFTTLSERLD